MSIFQDETHASLQSKFQNMINPTLVKEQVDSTKEVIVESKTEETVSKPEDTKQISESNNVGSKFNEIYNSCFGNTLVSEDAELSLGVEGEDSYEEDPSIDVEYEGEEEMIQVPASVIRELYAYLEDTMGAEDVTDVENLDIDVELEESNDGKPSALPNKLADLTVKGKTVQKDKTGTVGVGKTGNGGGNSKDKNGTPQRLSNILSHLIAKGTARQKGIPVGKPPVC